MSTATVLPRAASLVAVAACVAANGVVGDDVGAMSARWQTALTPAPFTFAIWGPIYAAFLLFLAAALLPRHRDRRAFGALLVPVVAVHVLGVAWIALFVREWLATSFVVIAVMLALAIRMLRRARVDVDIGALPGWATIPFSLLTGWLLIATLVDGTVLLKSLGFSGGPLGETRFALLLLCGAVAIGVGLALRYRDAVLPAVIAWAAFGIEVANRSGDNADEIVARTAFAVALLMAASSVILALAVGNGTRQAPAVLASRVG